GRPAGSWATPRRTACPRDAGPSGRAARQPQQELLPYDLFNIRRERAAQPEVGEELPALVPPLADDPRARQVAEDAVGAADGEHVGVEELPEQRDVLGHDLRRHAERVNALSDPQLVGPDLLLGRLGPEKPPQRDRHARRVTPSGHFPAANAGGGLD